MATITKTFTENIGNTPYSTWTLTASGINAVASETTFELTAPAVTAKFVNSQRKFALVRINDLLTLADGTIISGFTHDRGSVEYPIATNSGTQYTLSPDPDKRTSITSRIFNTNNPRERVVNVHFKQRTVTLETRTTETTGVSRYYSSEQIDWGVVATITLDAPPTYTLSALSKDTSGYYANLTTVSVTISSATAQYGGDISISSLTIGSQIVTGSGNGTLSMRLNNAGTFTPTVIVTDSRGQSTTKTLETITVQPYLVPSVSFDVYRTDASGVKDDEGHCGLIIGQMTYTDALANLTEPSVSIDGTPIDDIVGASITWYTGYSSSTGVDTTTEIDGTNITWSDVASGSTVYALIDCDYDITGKFSEGLSYQIGIVANDSIDGHSTPIIQTLSTAFYTIDFQAGGKEIAFGAPANDDLTLHPNGLFKCNMDAWFNGDVHIQGGGSGTSTPTADTTAQWDSDAHMNSEDMTSQEVDDFVDGLDTTGITAVDYIVEQGTDGIWTYRKWNSGIAELWGNTSGAISSGWSTSGITINLPFTLLTVRLTQVQFRNYQVGRAYTTIPTTNASSVNIQTQADSAVTGSFSINIKGTWK